MPSQDSAEQVQPRDAQRRIRRHVLLKGAWLSLFLVAAGLVGTWLPEGWEQSIVLGLTLALLLSVTQQMDPATRVEVARVRNAVWLALAASGLVAVAVVALTDRFLGRPLAFTASAVVTMAVWVVVGWRVGRAATRTH